jgi:hypothetical protein
MREIERDGATVLICHDPDQWGPEPLQLVYEHRKEEVNGNTSAG